VAAVHLGKEGCGFRCLVSGRSCEDWREALVHSHAPYLVQSPAGHQDRGADATMLQSFPGVVDGQVSKHHCCCHWLGPCHLPTLSLNLPFSTPLCSCRDISWSHG
jgi:hypothetical protein